MDGVSVTLIATAVLDILSSLVGSLSAMTNPKQAAALFAAALQRLLSDVGEIRERLMVIAPDQRTSFIKDRMEQEMKSINLKMNEVASDVSQLQAYEDALPGAMTAILKFLIVPWRFIEKAVDGPAGYKKQLEIQKLLEKYGVKFDIVGDELAQFFGDTGRLNLRNHIHKALEQARKEMNMSADRVKELERQLSSQMIKHREEVTYTPSKSYNANKDAKKHTNINYDSFTQQQIRDEVSKNDTNNNNNKHDNTNTQRGDNLNGVQQQQTIQQRKIL